MNFKVKLLEKLKKESLITGIPITLSSGESSDYYIDGKMTTLDPEGAYLTAGVFFETLKSLVDYDAVGGLTIGADPIVASLAVYSYIKRRPIKTFIVRKEAKEHGTRKWIEGKLGKKVVIVDDVVTTGKSIKDAIKAVEAEGSKVVKIIVLVDRKPEEKERFKGYEFESIFTKKDLGVV